MTELNFGNEIAEAIYRHHEAESEKKRRWSRRLPASGIGGGCDRKLWQTFRWIEQEKFEGRMLRLFETGNIQEARIVAELKAAGFNVIALDESTGKQIEVTDESGHFGGNIDGKIKGVPAAPKTWHLLEIKTHKEKYFNACKKHGVEKAKPEHYAQVQVYMHLLKLSRCLYIAINKNDEAIYEERIHYNAEVAMQLVAKANDIINFQNPPKKIADNGDKFPCAYCTFKVSCHEGKLPEVNCRTCLHASPDAGGQWSCDYHKSVLTLDAQKLGCEYHLFIPQTLNMQQIDATDDSVIYLAADGTRYENRNRKLTVIQPTQENA